MMVLQQTFMIYRRNHVDAVIDVAEQMGDEGYQEGGTLHDDVNVYWYGNLYYVATEINAGTWRVEVFQ